MGCLCLPFNNIFFASYSQPELMPHNLGFLLWQHLNYRSQLLYHQPRLINAGVTTNEPHIFTKGKIDSLLWPWPLTGCDLLHILFIQGLGLKSQPVSETRQLVAKGKEKRSHVPLLRNGTYSWTRAIDQASHMVKGNFHTLLSQGRAAQRPT